MCDQWKDQGHWNNRVTRSNWRKSHTHHVWNRMELDCSCSPRYVIHWKVYERHLPHREEGSPIYLTTRAHPYRARDGNRQNRRITNRKNCSNGSTRVWTKTDSSDPHRSLQAIIKNFRHSCNQREWYCKSQYISIIWTRIPVKGCMWSDGRVSANTFLHCSWKRVLFCN